MAVWTTCWCSWGLGQAAQSTDEIHLTATYTNVRRFSVATDETLKNPPGVH